MEKCDHCGSDIDCDNDQLYPNYSTLDFVIWCQNCISENSSILMELGVPFEENTYGLWSSKKSIEILTRLTKERNEAIAFGAYISEVPTERSFPAAKQVKDPPCKRVYYGIECDCHTCESHQKNNKKIFNNIFGYTNQELKKHRQ